MKRRSAQSAPRSQPEPLTYFADRDLAKRFPRRLRAAGVSVVGYHDPEAYPHDDAVSDREWIRMACSHGWVCLTHDKATKTDDTLDEVFRDWEKSGALFLLRGGISTERLADIFIVIHVNAFAGPIQIEDPITVEVSETPLPVILWPQ